MDVVKALKYPFNGKDWVVKNLILLACCVTVILLPAAIGYVLNAARRYSNNPDSDLPEWSGFGGLYLDGLRILVMQIVYSLPMFLLLGLALILVAFVGDGDFGSVGFLGVLIAIVAFCLGLVGSFLAIPGYLLMMAQPGSIAAGLQFGKVFSITKNNFGQLFMFVVYVIIVSLVAGLINGVTMGIASIVTTPLVMVVAACLYGQLYGTVMRGFVD